jgi:hypothetical protein
MTKILECTKRGTRDHVPDCGNVVHNDGQIAKELGDLDLVRSIETLFLFVEPSKQAKGTAGLKQKIRRKGWLEK